jgi:D-xylose transport system permease protein
MSDDHPSLDVRKDPLGFLRTQPGAGALRSLLRRYRGYAMFVALIVLWIGFQFLSHGVFLSTRNLALLARQTSLTGVLSIGAVILIISGNFDISTGSVLGLTGGIAAILHVWMGWSAPLAILAGIGVGLAIGAWQGYWVAYQRVPSFIVTLAGLMIWRGVLLVLTQGKTIAPVRDSFAFLGGGFLSRPVGNIILIGAIILLAVLTISDRRNKRKYGLPVPRLATTVASGVLIAVLMIVFVSILNGYQGIPVPVALLILLVVIFTWVMSRTTFGRAIYAIGGNTEAASLSGIQVKRHLLLAFVIMSGLSALAGVLMTARMNAAAPTAGQGMELDAIAAAVLGGTSLSGGIGTITGGILGAVIMATLDNGMSLFNISSYYQVIVKGLILLFAVWFDISAKRK